MSAELPRWKDGKLASAVDLEYVARAFGFGTARHMDDVLAGRAPSGLQSQEAFRRSAAERERRAAERAIEIESAELARIRRTQAEQNAKQLQRRENARHARRGVLARKAAADTAAAS